MRENCNISLNKDWSPKIPVQFRVHFLKEVFLSAMREEGEKLPIWVDDPNNENIAKTRLSDKNISGSSAMPPRQHMMADKG